MYLVKVRVTFSAAHRLYRPELSDEQNFKLYGKCSNPNGHGHNYDLEIAVEGQLDPETGMVINFYDLDKVVHERIFNKVDHRNLNTDVDFLQGIIPTAENMARCFWEQVEPCLSGARLHHICVGERGSNIVEYYGPKTNAASRESNQ